MIIGILTYHRCHNYGALLQAIALRYYLCKLGHKVTYIDYFPAYLYDMYAPFSWAYLKNSPVNEKLRYIKNIIFHYKTRNERIDSFNQFISKYIEPFVSSLRDSYDMIIYGSDQIWRKESDTQKYNPIFFGKHQVNAKYKISYAASMGILPQKEEDKAIIKDYLSSLDKISVRETSLKNLITSLDYECSLCVDPTFLLKMEDWRTLFNIREKNGEKYVLYYKLLGGSFDENQIKTFAKKNKLSLKILHSTASRNPSEKNIVTASPKEFLELVYNADFVFTSSFHGLVFSLLFHKDFYASFSSNSERASSLLEMIGLSDRLLNPKSAIPFKGKSVNYDFIDEKLSGYRMNSISFLSDINAQTQF